MIIILIILIFILIFFTPKTDKSDAIKTLVRQSSRWSTAASQDENPLIALLHANYGAGYLWALKDIATDTEIEKAMNINILKFRDEIVRVQDEVNLKVIKACPQFAPQQSYLTKLAKEGFKL
jgi:hypothetical protein